MTDGYLNIRTSPRFAVMMHGARVYANADAVHVRIGGSTLQADVSSCATWTDSSGVRHSALLYPSILAAAKKVHLLRPKAKPRGEFRRWYRYRQAYRAAHPGAIQVNPPGYIPTRMERAALARESRTQTAVEES